MGVNCYLANYTREEITGYLGQADEFDLEKAVDYVMTKYDWKKTDKIALIDDDGNYYDLKKLLGIYRKEKLEGEDEDGLGPQSRAEMIYAEKVAGDLDKERELVDRAFDTFAKSSEYGELPHEFFEITEDFDQYGGISTNDEWYTTDIFDMGPQRYNIVLRKKESIPARPKKVYFGAKKYAKPSKIY